MKHNKRILLAGAVAACALMLAGCGGQALGGTTTPTGNAVGTYKNPVPPGDLAASVLNGIQVDSSLAKHVPASVKESGLTVATADGYPPMEMFDKDGKTLVGVDMSLIRAVGDIWGVKVNIENADQNSMVPGVASGRYDVVISGLNDTAARREKVTFVDYAQSLGAIVVKAGNPESIKTPADLCGKTLAVLDNGYYMQLGEQYSKTCTDGGKKKITIMGFASDPEALLQLRNGRADAGMNDYPVAMYRAKESGGAVEAVEIPGSALFGIGVAPSNKDLITLLQDTLTKMMSDGQYADIFKSWDLTNMAIDKATINQGS